MQTTDIPQELDSIDWGTPQSHYPARGQAPEIYATRLNVRMLGFASSPPTYKTPTHYLLEHAATLQYSTQPVHTSGQRPGAINRLRRKSGGLIHP